MDDEVRLIDANALKETLKNLCSGSNRVTVRRIEDCMLHDIFPRIIDDEPTIEAEPVTWYTADENQPDSVADDVLVVDSYGKYHIAYYLSGSENWMNQDTKEPIKNVVKWRYLGGDNE